MRKAQSTLEYILILTVTILALLYASRDRGPFKAGLGAYFNSTQQAFARAAR